MQEKLINVINKIAEKTILESKVDNVEFLISIDFPKPINFKRLSLNKNQILLNPCLLLKSYQIFTVKYNLLMTVEEFTIMSMAHELGHSVCKKMSMLDLDTKINLTTFIMLEISAWKNAVIFLPSDIAKTKLINLAIICLNSYAVVGGIEYMKVVESTLRKQVG